MFGFTGVILFEEEWKNVFIVVNDKGWEIN
jgi:hypothetical protein